jgi:hypothetical protein
MSKGNRNAADLILNFLFKKDTSKRTVERGSFSGVLPAGFDMKSFTA